MIRLSLQSLVVALTFLFIYSTISQIAKPAASRLYRLFAAPVLPEPLPPEDEAAEQKVQQAREIAQQSFQLQAADYVERILKPRQEEKRKKREMHFRRFFSHRAGEGHILGDGSSSSMRQQTAADSEPLSETTRQRRGRLLDKLERKTELPEEPGFGEEGVITLALRTPDNEMHKRRFNVSDFVRNVVAYMEAVGYSQSSYSLLLPYPRQCISDSLDMSLVELGIVADSTLIVDQND